MAVRLYQFAISHYSEKVRWALDYKGIAYEPVWLLPGMHVRTIRGLTGQKDTQVPVLVHDSTVVQGSSAILDYLDETFPDQPLTPDDAHGKASALAWEKRLDEEAGPAVRTFAYHHLLQRPKLVAPMLTAKTPFWNRYIVLLAFSRIDEQMREYMKINEKTAAKAQQALENLLDELGEIYRQRPYLVGNSLTRADITAGALFAPLIMPEQYPVPWPRQQRLPPEMKVWIPANEARLAPLAAMYQRNR